MHKLLFSTALLAGLASPALATEPFGLSDISQCVRLLHAARYVGVFHSAEKANQSYISAADVEGFAGWVTRVGTTGIDTRWAKRCVAALRKFTD